MKIGHDKNPHHVYMRIWMWVIAPSYLFFCEILHHAQDCQNILVMIRFLFICYPKPKICLILPSFWFSMLQGCLHFADSILLLGGCLGKLQVHCALFFNFHLWIRVIKSNDVYLEQVWKNVFCKQKYSEMIVCKQTRILP